MVEAGASGSKGRTSQATGPASGRKINEALTGLTDLLTYHPPPHLPIPSLLPPPFPCHDSRWVDTLLMETHSLHAATTLKGVTSLLLRLLLLRHPKNKHKQALKASDAAYMTAMLHSDRKKQTRKLSRVGAMTTWMLVKKLCL